MLICPVAIAPAEPLLAPEEYRAQASSPRPATVTNAVLGEWFRAHAGQLWRFVARLGVPAHSIEDVVQEAFVAASRRLDDIGEGRARGFLFAAAIRLSSNYRQRAHVRRELSAGEQIEYNAAPEPDAEQLLMEKRMRELLDRALSALSDEHRAVFVLYELEGFSVPEIALLLELPLGTAASRLGRARAKFSEVAARLQPGDTEGR
jgi:RNA polymerase sigma-70 factor (ECF subfamily)